MTGDGRRPRRVAETLRANLVQLMRRELSDPLLTTLVITELEMPPDLSSAKISVRLLEGDEAPGRREAALGALLRAAPRLRRLVAPSLRLRRAPELRFVYDTGHEASRRVEELLAEIAADPHSPDDDQ